MRSNEENRVLDQIRKKDVEKRARMFQAKLAEAIDLEIDEWRSRRRQWHPLQHIRRKYKIGEYA